ncbi:OmpA family protein [Sinorhizobium sp. BG8]|uniref:OmpA family protein n=1 Tax=Sinorhizobium sp. BG8 TaxID=2613773 RepID=UPI00193D3781|nr:OmpA family protein [Sinorhizobium sp. BG8]
MNLKSILATIVVTLSAAFPASAACSAVNGIVEAFNNGNETAARSIAGSSEVDSCTADEKTLIGRVASLTAFNRITTDVQANGNLAGQERTLDELQREYGGPWQVFDALGDIARERRDYGAAARYYQLALEDSANETLTPQWMAPDEAYIRRMDRLANEMRLAAPGPVKLAMRGGCKVSFRGIKITKKSTPVRYVFGTAEFTPEGAQAAKDLADCLKAVRPAAITLVGHTDPIGTNKENLSLSVARAETLAAYLAAHGFSGAIAIEGRGEEEPFQPDDPSAYDEEMLNQLNRRVEVDVHK